MGRPIREWVPGGTYHVFTRGSNRQAIFVYDSDRLDFLTCLAGAIDRYELRCLAFALMPNHWHLLVQTPDSRLSQAMKTVNGRYSLRFNRRYQRDAHLFKNRFGAVLQEDEDQLLGTARYIVLNPIRSGLCAHPAEWPWSSYRSTARLGPRYPFLADGELLSYFGNTADEAIRGYVDFVAGSGV